MGKDTVINGVSLLGGITYGNIEEVVVKLGHSGYTVDVDASHSGGTTVYHMGVGNDVANVHSTEGPVLIYGDKGDDRLSVGEQSGDFSRLHGMVAFDGAQGNDFVAIDNGKSTAVPPKGKPQVGVLAHDHVSGFGWKTGNHGTFSVNLYVVASFEM